MTENIDIDTVLFLDFIVIIDFERKLFTRII